MSTIVSVSGNDILVIELPPSFFLEVALMAVQRPPRPMVFYTTEELAQYTIERVTLLPHAKTDTDIYRRTNTCWGSTRVLAEGIEEIFPFVRIMDGDSAERWIPLPWVRIMDGVELNFIEGFSTAYGS